MITSFIILNGSSPMSRSRRARVWSLNGRLPEFQLIGDGSVSFALPPVVLEYANVTLVSQWQCADDGSPVIWTRCTRILLAMRAGRWNLARCPYGTPKWSSPASQDWPRQHNCGARSLAPGSRH